MALIIYQQFNHRGGKVNCGLKIITSLLIIAHLKRTFPADAHLCTLLVLHVNWLSVKCQLQLHEQLSAVSLRSPVLQTPEAAWEPQLYFNRNLHWIINWVMNQAASQKHCPKVQVVLWMLSNRLVVLIPLLTQTLACMSSQACPHLCSVCEYCVLTNNSSSICWAARKPGHKSQD